MIEEAMALFYFNGENFIIKDYTVDFVPFKLVIEPNYAKFKECLRVFNKIVVSTGSVNGFIVRIKYERVENSIEIKEIIYNDEKVNII